ncbi:MAG: translation initiation factor 2 [Firmicutes bacterium]|nr:translation initiation factor 2 [Bacillota bacterium]MCL5038885.1 translation initiation factor 2 [Bacillota bacterium]
MEEKDYVSYLESQVKFLEERVRSLRAGRRILMNLLQAQEQEKRVSLSRLDREKKQLARKNRLYAREVLERSLQIRKLERSLWEWQQDGTKRRSSGSPPSDARGRDSS